MLILTSHCIIPTDGSKYTSSHQSSTYVVSYNKLRCRANATKLGSKLLTISKKVLARQRMLVLTSHRLSPQTATSIHHLSQSSTYVLSAIINYTVVPSQQNLVETFRRYPRRTCALTHARSDGSHRIRPIGRSDVSSPSLG